MRLEVLVSAATLTLAMAGAPAGADVLEPPRLTPDYSVAEFRDRHPDEGVLVIQKWVGLEVGFRARDAGLSGRLIEVREHLVQGRGDLEEVSFMVTYESPTHHLKKFKVEIDRNGQKTAFKRKDLVWHDYTSRSDGVVTLDGTDSWAMVPGLMVGDRIRTVVEYELKGLSGLPPIQLGSSDWPYLETELVLVLPEEYTLAWGGVPGGGGRDHLVHSIAQSKGKTVNRWRLAAGHDGSLASCRDDYPSFRVVPHIVEAGRSHEENMAIGADWSAVGEAYLNRIDGVFDADDATSRLAAELTGGVHGRMEKIDRIYAAVQKKCRYLGLYEGAGGIVPVPAAEVLDSGFGDCKGLGTLLISLLRESGFEAHPVLVRTSSAGRLDPDIPNMAQFNHFIAWVDTGGGGLFLDGTVEYCPAGLVPPGDALSKVLLLEPGAIRMTEIPAESWFAGSSRRRMSGRIGPDGRLELDCLYSVTGSLGMVWRDYLAGKEGQERIDRLKVELLPEGIPLEAGTPLIQGMDDWRGPLSLEMSASGRKPLPGTGGGFFLPRQLGGVLLRFEPELDCEYPLDLRRRPSRSESWIIELPAGVRLAQSDSLFLREPGLEWECRIWQDGTTLRLERSLRFTEDFLTTKEAEELKAKVAEAVRRDTGYIQLNRRAEAGH